MGLWDTNAKPYAKKTLFTIDIFTSNVVTFKDKSKIFWKTDGKTNVSSTSQEMSLLKQVG